MQFLALAILLALSMQNVSAQKDGYPSISPNGAYLAFVSTRTGDEQIFVISPDGSHEKQLTNSKDKKNAPYWSLEGFILFSISDDDGSRLFSVMPDGSNLRQIGKVPGRNPKLAPDGEHVIYAVGPWTASRLILSELHNPQPRQLTGNDATVWTGWWSPDGEQIAYASEDAAKELHVWAMHANGSNQRQITHVAAAEGRAQWPVWSPDSRQLAIQVGRYSKAENTSHIWVVNLTTGLAAKLAAHDQPFLDETPAWFPDGKHIAFQSNRSGRMAIWTMKSDGTELRQVTGAR
jgi:Tol biopolymer transport system component